MISRSRVALRVRPILRCFATTQMLAYTCRFHSTETGLKTSNHNTATETTETTEPQPEKVNVDHEASSKTPGSSSQQPWYLRQEFAAPDMADAEAVFSLAQQDSITYPDTLEQTKDAEFVKTLAEHLQSKLGLSNIIVFDMQHGDRDRPMVGKEDIIIVASAKSGRHCIGSVESLRKELKHTWEIDGGGINVEGIVSSTLRKKEHKRLQRKGGQLKRPTEWFNKASGDWIVIEFTSKQGCRVMLNVLDEQKRNYLNLEELYCKEEDLEKYTTSKECVELDRESEFSYTKQQVANEEDDILLELRKQLAQKNSSAVNKDFQKDAKRHYSTHKQGKFVEEKQEITALNQKWMALSQDHLPNEREWELRLLDLQKIMEHSENIYFYEQLFKNYLDVKLLMGERMKLSELLKINILCISHIYKVTEGNFDCEELRSRLTNKMMVKLLRYFDFVKSVQTMSIAKFLLLSLKQVSGTSKFYALTNLIQLTHQNSIPQDLKNQILRELVKNGDFIFLQKFWSVDTNRFDNLIESWTVLVKLLEQAEMSYTSHIKTLVKQELLSLLQRDLCVFQIDLNNAEIYSRLLKLTV